MQQLAGNSSDTVWLKTMAQKRTLRLFSGQMEKIKYENYLSCNRSSLLTPVAGSNNTYRESEAGIATGYGRKRTGRLPRNTFCCAARGRATLAVSSTRCKVERCTSCPQICAATRAARIWASPERTVPQLPNGRAARVRQHARRQVVLVEVGRRPVLQHGLWFAKNSTPP